tara:strand:+ start:112 stop:984 length:873 start_codon:yes stop_codon:yes gene_type:complete
MNKEEFLKHGGLDFTVSKKKMSYIDDGFYDTPFYCTVNDKTTAALGPVRSRYTVVQNTDLLDLVLDKLVDGSYDLSTSRCGQFAGGKKIYFFIRLNDIETFDGAVFSDQITKYLYALSSHDGSQKLVFGISTKMHSCSNMFSILMSNKDNMHVVKHTKQIENINSEKINEMITRNMTGLKKLYTKLNEHTPSQELIERTADIIASSKLKSIPIKTAERRKELMECIEMEMDSKGNTHFGLFNGVTNYLTHRYKTNWSSDYEMLTGNSNKYSNKALNLLVKDLVDNGVILN